MVQIETDSNEPHEKSQITVDIAQRAILSEFCEQVTRMLADLTEKSAVKKIVPQ